MEEGNTRVFVAAWRATDAGDATAVARLAGRLAQRTPSLVQHDFVQTVLPSQVAPPDREILADPGIRRLLVENFRQAASERNLGAVEDGATDVDQARHVLLGWLDDVLAFSRPWGFDPGDIAVPVLVWHGEDDVLLPVEHAHWLADRIPDSTLVTAPGAAHFGALVVLPSVLLWLRRFTPPRLSSA
jgi:pimeloyl-ACP methyl ester carboxylesterase